MESKPSRRAFLKGCLITAGGVGAAAVGTGALVPLAAKTAVEFDDYTCYWGRDRTDRNPPLSESIDVDTAIIGGGYTGLSCAHYLSGALPNRTVVVLEGKTVGHGASGRNGGMLLPQPNTEYFRMASKPDIHKFSYDVTAENVYEIESLMKRYGYSDDITITGAVQTIAQPHQVEGYREYIREAQALGLPFDFWDAGKTAEMLGTAVYHGAMYDPHSAEVNPMGMVRALKAAAEDAGTTVFEESPVTNIVEEDDGTVSLYVGDGDIRVWAKSVVLATNGYTANLGLFRNRVLPFHTQSAVTPPLDDDTFEKIGWRERTPFADTNLFLYHLGTTQDNRILIGGGSVDYFFNGKVPYRGDLAAIQGMLENELHRIYPGLSDVGLEHVWDGVIGVSMDLTQSVGVTGKNKNIYYGLAYSGHGVNLSHLFGRIIADMIAGDAKKWRRLPFVNRKFIPIPPEPFRFIGARGAFSLLHRWDESHR